MLLLGGALGLSWWIASGVSLRFEAKALLAAALTFILAALLLRLRARAVSNPARVSTVSPLIANDPVACFMTDDDGRILLRNPAARTRFQDTESLTLPETLRAVMTNPSAVLYRLYCVARESGSASEDIVTRNGHIRLTIQTLDDAHSLWRIADLPSRSVASGGIDSSPLPGITLGRSGAILFMNDAARQLLGTRPKSVEFLLVNPLVSGQPNTVMTKNGEVDVLVSVFDSQANRRQVFLTPLSGNLNAGLETGDTFQSFPVPILKLSPAGDLLAINRLAQRLLGDSAARGTHVAQIMQGLGRPVTDWMRETAQGRSSSKSEFLRLSRQDREVFVQVTLSRTIEEGEPVLIAVLTDATELKTLEAQFVQSQKMQAIGQLAGGVAHDFNNLLTAISGHCDLLLLRHDHGDQDYGDLIQINQNANRAAALVGQLLAFSRKQTLRPETLDLRDTLSDLAHLLNRLVGEKVTLTLCHDPVLRSIRADKRQLEQVLMNLVVNARDAMPNGGEIRIETEVVSLDTAVKRDRATLEPGDYVSVKVRDEGVGIEPDAIQKVFEPFYSTKRQGEGTGLGLSTVYGIVKQTGGYIFVESVVGEGTEFSLYLPVSDDITTPEPEAPKQLATATTVQGDGVVLLVEDEAPVRAFASRALRLRGYTVLEAESAEEALVLLEDPDLNVDVFVTDVVMPGMNGPSWVRKAQEQRPDVRVVFVSGYAEGALGEAEPNIANSVFLPKPFSLTQLTETVHRQLH